jgi:rare lipoprotein A
MLAQAAAERLTLETTIDDRPPAPPAADVAPVARDAPPSPGPATSVAAGVWLQFGAFASRDNAEQARARLQREVPWLLVPAELVQVGDTWRVLVGPWDRREDAVAVADRIATSGGTRPVAVAR